MAPKVSEEYLEERRQEILDAAVACFSRSGFHQTTIEDIRLEAEISRGALYHYFKTKEDIIDAIRQRSSQQADSIYAETSQAEDGMSRLLDLTNAAFSTMASPASVEANRLALFLWAESLVNQRIMDGQLDSFGPFLKRVSNDVSNAQRGGLINSTLDPTVIARVISGAMLGLQIQLAWEPDVDMDEARRVMLAILNGELLQHEQLKRRAPADL